MNRNTSLDLMKGIAALFVIWIHKQLPGVTGQPINRIGSFAVPIFFMVSGYFSCNATIGCAALWYDVKKLVEVEK